MTRHNMMRGAVLGLAILQAACVVVPFPAPSRTRAKGVTHNAIELNFLKVGETSREQVLGVLGDFVTDAATESFLWFRWESSNYGWAGGVGSMSGAGIGGASGGGRVWARKNLLAAFDTQGKLTSYQLPGDQELLQALWSVLEASLYTPTGPVEPFQLDFKYPKTSFLGDDVYVFGHLAIESGELRYRVQGKQLFRFAGRDLKPGEPGTEYQASKTADLRTTSLKAIRRVELKSMEMSQDLIVRLYFGEREPSPDPFVIGASPRDTLRLLGILRGAGFVGPEGTKAR